MNKNQKKKLEAIMRKYESASDDCGVMMCQVAFAISENKGIWTKDGKPFNLSWRSLNGSKRSSSNAIFCRDAEDTMTGIKRMKNGKLFAFNDCEFQCEIKDPDLISVIDELAHISKPQRSKKATKKTEVKKPVTYMDVFKRVHNFMSYKTGFAPNDVESEDDEVDICLDDDGNEHKFWTNAKAFVGGDPEEPSIFEEVADLDDIYDKLASRWDAEFCDSCRILGNVKVKDTSPAGIMKALDEAGL